MFNGNVKLMNKLTVALVVIAMLIGCSAAYAQDIVMLEDIAEIHVPAGNNLPQVQPAAIPVVTPVPTAAPTPVPAEESAPAVTPAPAQEEAQMEKCYVRFLKPDGSLARSVEVKKGETVEAPKGLHVEQEGFRFVAWQVEDRETGKLINYSFGKPVKRSLTLVPLMEAVTEEPTEEATQENNEEQAQEAAQGQEPEENAEDAAMQEAAGEETAKEQETEEAVEEAAQEQEAEEPLEETEEEMTEEQGEEAEESQGEEEEEALEETAGEAQQEALKRVSIATTASGEVKPGDVMTLFAIVEGYEDGSYQLVWQYNNGNGWKDAQTGGSTMNFVLSEENYTWDWRLELTVLEDAAQ